MADAPQIHTITTDERRNISVDMSGLLDDGELLTGTPVVQGSTDLTLTNKQINTGSITVNGSSLVAGLAVQFTVESNVVGRYSIELLVNTDASQLVEGEIILIVE